MTATGPKRRGLHQIALAALFTVGNTLLRFPWRNAEAGMSASFLVSGIAAVCAVSAFCPIARKLLRKPIGHRVPRAVGAAVFCVVTAAIALDCASRCAADAVAFFGETLLPNGTRIPFSVLFLASAVCLSRIPRRGVDAFALIAFLASSVAVAVLFLRGVPQFRPEYGTVEFPTPAVVGASLQTLLPEVLLPMVPLAAYLGLATPQPRKRGATSPPILGVLTGCGLLFICVLQTLLTFGAGYAASVVYPYSKAVRVVSVGQYAFRPEILSYLLDYAACLGRTALCFACVRRAFGRFLPRAARYVPYLLGLVVFLSLYLR